MIHLYAITADESPVFPAVRGVEGAELEMVSTRGLAAVFSRHGSPPAVEEDTLWAHETVVEALMAHRDVLPARFGAGADDEETLRSGLATGGHRYRALLERVAGHVEVGVRFVWPEPAPGANPPSLPREDDAGAPGRRYMQNLMQVKQEEADLRSRSEEILGRVNDSLLRHATSCSTRVTRQPPSLGAAYLVHRDRLEEFLAVVERVRAEVPDVTMVCTGPWPPYSFVSELEAS